MTITIQTILQDPRVSPKVKEWLSIRESWIGDSISISRVDSMDDIGKWWVCGEDPNADLLGSHVMPYLGTVAGPYWEVLNKVVELPGFFSWGCGGSLSLLSKLQANASNCTTKKGNNSSMHNKRDIKNSDTSPLTQFQTSALLSELVRRTKEVRSSEKKSNNVAVDENQVRRAEEHRLFIEALSALPGGQHIVKAICDQAQENVRNRLTVAPR